jgi:hypothetical protein
VAGATAAQPLRSANAAASAKTFQAVAAISLFTSVAYEDHR